MRVALAQIGPAATKFANLRRLREEVASAARAGAELIVLPEATIGSLDAAETRVALAEPLDGPFVSGLADAARECGIAVVVGTFEPYDETHVFNTVAVLGADGALLGSYRKIHLYDAFDGNESADIRPGDGRLLTLQLGDFRMGVMTCYDLRFPEIARALVDAGSEVLLVPAAWVRGPLKEEHWEALLRARAIENTVYVVGAGKISAKYIGCSMVADPMGVPIARSGEEEMLLVADLSRDRLHRVRAKLPSLEHRRFAVSFVSSKIPSLV
jgi:predicted amidohydrolase